jgi:hypothetical protein
MAGAEGRPMHRDDDAQRSLDEARERTARDTGRFRAAVAWGAVLLAGLAAAGVLVYWVYRAFSGVIEHRVAGG